MNDGESLKVSAIRGFAWVFIFSSISRGVQFLASLILAKLLMPEDFGAFALGMLLINALIMFREMGLTPALIQRQDNVERAFRVGLVLLPLYGLGLFIVIFILAVPFSKLVDNASMVPLMRVLGLAAPISSLGVLPAAWFQRQIDFKRKVLPEILSALLGSGLMIFLALIGWGVWSLAWGRVATEFFRTLLYWLASGFRWKPLWDADEAKKLFRFGSVVSLGSVTALLYYLVDQMVVGKYMGIRALGFYSFAFRIASLPVTGLTIVLSQVMLPVMSRLQDDLDQLGRVVGKNIAINALLTAPFCVGIFLFGGDLLQLLYGHKWDGAIILLKIFACYSLIWSLMGPMNNVYIAMGKAVYFPLIATIKLVLAIVGMFWAVPQGNPEAVAHVFTWVSLVSYIYGYHLGAKLMKKSIFYFMNFVAPYFISILPGYLCFKLVESQNWGLIFEMLTFFISYFACLILLAKNMLKEVVEMSRELVSGKLV